MLKEHWVGILTAGAVLLVVLSGSAALWSLWLNNLASLALLAEWEQVTEQWSPPRCQEQVIDLKSAALTKKALASNLWNQRAWLNSGRVAWLEGRCYQAVEAWQHALHLAPGDAVATLNLTLAIHTTDYLDDKPPSLGDRGVASYCYYRGLQAEQAGIVDAAIEWYKLSLKIAPARPTVEALVEYYLGHQQTIEAINAWGQLAHATPEIEADHWWALAQAAQLAKDWNAALAAYQRGAQVSESPFDFYMEMGHLQRKRGQYEAALIWYQQARVADPNRWGPEHFQGVVYYHLEDFDRAKVFLLKANVQNPSNPFVWYYLGLSEYKAGHLPEAVHQLRQAVLLCQREITCRNQVWQWGRLLGDWYTQGGRCEDAVRAYQQVLSWRPDEPTVMERLNAARNCLADKQ
ncbi:MAG: hypothetical protein M5U01_40860 [Ardenticatenaceae bacterium]|nr:hypothetical protein [Ardenticatenaceae bacterium]